MRKFIVIFTLIALIGPALPAHEKKERKLTLQSSPLLFLIDVFANATADSDSSSLFVMDLEGQYKINDIFNVSLTTSFFVYKEPDDQVDEKGFQFILKPMFVYRPFRTGLKGFYLGLYSNVGWQTENSFDEKEFWTEIGFGMNIGYKWVFHNGFTLQLGTGIGKTWTLSDSDSYTVLNSDGRMVGPNLDLQILGLKLGYSF